MLSSRQKVLYVLVTSSVVFLLIIASSRYKNSGKINRYSRLQMGTVVELTLYGAQGVEMDLAAKAAFDEIERLETIFSSYRASSDVSKISRSAGRPPVKVAPEVIEVLKTARRISELSHGAFDPTIGVLGELWSFSGETVDIPAKKRVEELLKLVDYRAIIIKDSSAGMARKGMRLNLGGVAKGYIIGRVVEVLKARGIEKMIVKAGGDMFVASQSKDAPFEIGITHPRKKGRLLASLEVFNGTVTTSGDYERFFIKDNIRYHHILDPKTGFPARRSISATVLSDNPMLSDAFSTALFVMGPLSGMEMIESIKGVEAVMVGANGSVYISSGLKGRIKKRVDSVDIKGP